MEPDHDTKRRRIRAVAMPVAAVLAMIGSTMALADEGVPEPLDGGEVATETTAPPEPIEYRPDDHVIVFSLPNADGIFVECAAAVVTDEGEGPVTDLEGCFAAHTLGPAGQQNHGQVVRAYVHAIKDLEFDGPRGHLVRNAARSAFGKGTVDGEAASDGTFAKAGGKAKGKDKAGKGKH
jgi:hypothetical protein